MVEFTNGNVITKPFHSNFRRRHLLSNVQPMPLLLAYVKRCNEEDTREIPKGRNAFPLQFFKKKKKSPCFKVSNGFFCCLGFFRPIGRLIIRLTKCLPGGTAVEENFINPISYWSSWEKSCRFVQKFSYLWLHWCKFFSGSLAINTSVSN